jgi:hypothetical protein
MQTETFPRRQQFTLIALLAVIGVFVAPLLSALDTARGW